MFKCEISSTPAVTTNLSGVTYARSNLPAATFSSTLVSFCVDPRYVAQIPFSITATVLLFMRAIVGVRTTVIFFITRGGTGNRSFCLSLWVAAQMCSFLPIQLVLSWAASHEKKSSQTASPESLSFSSHVTLQSWVNGWKLRCYVVYCCWGWDCFTIGWCSWYWDDGGNSCEGARGGNIGGSDGVLLVRMGYEDCQVATGR